MKKIFFFVFLALLQVSGKLQGQSTIRFQPRTIVGFITTVNEWQSVTDSVFLKNLGPSSCTAVFSLVTALQDTVGPGRRILDTTFYSSVTIPVLGIKKFILNRTYLTGNTTPPGFYRIGNNVIVIWPITNAPNVDCRDTIRDTVRVLRATGIGKIDINDFLNIYPNPAQSSFTIEHTENATNAIEEVTLYDVEGKSVARFMKQHIIDLQGFSKGSYIVEIKFYNGRVARRKLLLE